jgi:hypothetical protein
MWIRIPIPFERVQPNIDTLTHMKLEIAVHYVSLFSLVPALELSSRVWQGSARLSQLMRTPQNTPPFMAGMNAARG